MRQKVKVDSHLSTTRDPSNTLWALFDVSSVITLGILTLLAHHLVPNSFNTKQKRDFPTSDHEGMFTNKPHNEHWLYQMLLY